MTTGDSRSLLTPPLVQVASGVRLQPERAEDSGRFTSSPLCPPPDRDMAGAGAAAGADPEPGGGEGGCG